MDDNGCSTRAQVIYNNAVARDKTIFYHESRCRFCTRSWPAESQTNKSTRMGTPAQTPPKFNDNAIWHCHISDDTNICLNN